MEANEMSAKREKNETRGKSGQTAEFTRTLASTYMYIKDEKAKN